MTIKTPATGGGKQLDSCRIIFENLAAIRFSAKLRELRFYLSGANINSEDICVVGSSVLNLLGIREANDIDIIVADKISDRFEKGPQKLNDEKTLEKVTSGWLRDAAGIILISDDELIYNSSHHFRHDGIKFVKLEYVYFRKSVARRDNDIADLKLIENYLI